MTLSCAKAGCGTSAATNTSEISALIVLPSVILRLFKAIVFTSMIVVILACQVISEAMLTKHYGQVKLRLQKFTKEIRKDLEYL